MTKLLAIFAAIVLVLIGINIPVSHDEPRTEMIPEEIVEMTGIVLEIAPEYYLIQTADGQQVQVNRYEETLYEGDEPTVGALIHVLYNGMMTRSLPPQINAIRIGCYSRTGAVAELTENGFTLDCEMEIIEVNAEANLLEGLEAGQTVTVYFNGAMTMSLPAQIGAELIVPAGK